MRGSRPLVVVLVASLLTLTLTLALAACSGGPQEGPTSDRPVPVPKAGTYRVQAATTKDAASTGPAPAVEDATSGGTITVYLPGAPGPDTLDPTGAWSVTGNAIQQALVSRSLTQYARGDDGQPVLVPDLATDLGRPNDDFTEWTFTIRDDATWEDGRPVTADEVAFGICRSLDSEAFPSGAGTEYSTPYFEGGEDYQGPYTGNDPTCEKWDGISVSGQDVTITMAVPFPDMDYWGAVMTMGPAPLGAASDPSRYAQKPLANGPYRVETWDPAEKLVLVRNDEWSAASDPARHQYPDRWVFRFNQDQDIVDEMLLSDSSAGRAALSTSLGPGRYVDASAQLGARLVQQTTDCVSTLTPDYTTITDLRVRKALAYAYPYEDVWTADGEVPGVTRVPASSVMPPGLPGRKAFQVDGEQITYDPDRARELLAEAGFGDEPYAITMIYYALDPQARAAQEQITHGFEAGGFSVEAIPVEESPYGIWLNPDDPLNKLLNVRAANVCPAWPAGSATLPVLLKAGAVFNTAQFDEPSVDATMDDIATLPIAEQPAAWGDLDEAIMTTYFPTIPVAYVNRLFVFGTEIGNPSGDGSLGMPNYKDLYVVQ